MDEVEEFCRRVLGARATADAAAAKVKEEGHGDRVAMLAAAARACREQAERSDGATASGASPALDEASGEPAPSRLADAVARELAVATASLPEGQREALALRELLRLSYAEISRVMEIEPTAIAPLLARARLRLRAARRGTAIDLASCAERERSLRILAGRQDSEPLTREDDEWLLAHLAHCEPCEMAHAAMLEASVCYRAWSREELTGTAAR